MAASSTQIRISQAARILIFAVASILSFASCSATFAADKKEVKPAGDGNMIITTDSVVYSIDDNSFNIPGNVTIEMPDAVITGKALTYNGKTGKGEMSGDPLKVKYSRSGDTVMTASGITFDTASSTARISGGVDINHSTSTTVARIHCATIDFDFNTAVTEASGKVTLEISGQSDTVTTPRTAGGAIPATRPFATTPAVFTADFMRYNMKTGIAVTGDNPAVRLPDATLTSPGPIRVSLKDRVAQASSGLDFFASPDIRAHSDQADVWYGERTAVLSGHVSVSRGRDTITAASVRIEYGKSGAVVSMAGGVRIRMNVKLPTGEPSKEKLDKCGEYSSNRHCPDEIEP